MDERACRRLVVELLPEAADRIAIRYVQSQPNWLPAHGANAFCLSPRLALAFGIEGCLVAFYPSKIESIAAEYGESVDDTLRGLLLHECAHAVVGLARPTQRLAPHEARQRFAAIEERKAKRREREDDPLPWLGHPISWVRAFCHLVARAESADVGIPISTWLNTHKYRLSSLLKYKSLFAAEIQRWGDRSLLELADEPMPTAACQQFADDITSAWTEEEQIEQFRMDYANHVRKLAGLAG